MPALIPSRPSSVALNCGIASSLSFSLSGFSSVDLAVPNAREAVAMEVKERAKFHDICSPQKLLAVVAKYHQKYRRVASLGRCAFAFAPVSALALYISIYSRA